MLASIRGTKIYFDIAGPQLIPSKNGFSERPVLFLLHGGPGGDHLRYKLHSLALQDVAQLVFIDNRGCGRSKKGNPKQYTLENNLKDVEALRKYLGLKCICILGTSYGGVVAQAYAMRYPKTLEKLILVATTPSYRFLENAKQNLQQQGTPQQIKACESLWQGSFKNSAQVQDFFKLMDSLYSVTAKQNQQKGFAKSTTVWSHQALNNGFKDFLRTFDFIPKLKKITHPTLVLGGENDWICSAEQSRIIAQHIPHSQLKIFKKCGHAISVDAHDQYIQVIKKFLQ